VHHRFLFDDYGCANGRIIKKRLGHFPRDANAAMRCGIRRHIALMHRVTAAEKHRVRHTRAVVMRTRRFGILACIDIGFHDVTKIVYVIAEDSRHVRRIFR